MLYSIYGCMPNSSVPHGGFGDVIKMVNGKHNLTESNLFQNLSKSFIGALAPVHEGMVLVKHEY